MTFVYPNFLWALFAIAIPIIIHFFNFRTHKTVYFSNVAFLQNIEQETKSRNRLKDLLVLLMRILTIAALVIAFAKPVKYSQNRIISSSCGNNYGIYIDNSFSMTSSGGDATKIDYAKSKASDILTAFGQNSNYLFLTNEITPEQQHFYIKDIAQNFISQSNVSPIIRNTSFVYDKFNTLFSSLTPNCTNNLFIISDFQKNTFDPENIIVDTNTNVVLLPVTSYETSNLYIDSVWFLSPYHLSNSNDSLIVRLKNNSDIDFSNQQIKLFINDTLKTLSTFNIQANQQLDLKLIFTNTELGFIRAKVSIEDYPITYDNEMFFNYYIAPSVKLLLVEGKEQDLLKKFYTDGKYFDLTVVDENGMQVGDIYNYQAIVLASVKNLTTSLYNELINYVNSGGILIIIPDLKSDFSSLNSSLNAFNMPEFAKKDSTNLYVKDVNIFNKIYKNAFDDIGQNSEFPIVYDHLKFKQSTFLSYDVLLNLENDDEFLISKDIGDGCVYLFTSEMIQEYGNFMLNPISIASFYNMPVFKKDINKIYQTIGFAENILINNIPDYEAIKLKNINSDIEFFPKVNKLSASRLKINVSDFNIDAGNYLILNQDEQIGLLSINHSRKEANLDYYNSSELEEIIKKYNLKNWQITENAGEVLQNELQTNLEGKNFWKLFVVLALFFILLEILLIRLIKK